MFSDENVKVSVNDFLIKAAAIALQVSSYTSTVGKQTLWYFCVYVSDNVAHKFDYLDCTEILKTFQAISVVMSPTEGEWGILFLCPPTKGEGDILFLVWILLARHFLVCTISHELVGRF